MGVRQNHELSHTKLILSEHGPEVEEPFEEGPSDELDFPGSEVPPFHEAPPEDHETLPEHPETPPDHHETPPDHHETPPDHHETPPDHHETPPDHHETPPEDKDPGEGKGPSDGGHESPPGEGKTGPHPRPTSKPKSKPKPKGPPGSTDSWTYYEVSSSTDVGRVDYTVPTLPICADGERTLMSMYVLKGDLVSEQQEIEKVTFNNIVEFQSCKAHAANSCQWIGSLCGEVDVTSVINSGDSAANVLSFSPTSSVKAICDGSSFVGLVSFRCESFVSPFSVAVTQSDLSRMSEPISSSAGPSGFFNMGIVGTVIVVLFAVFFTGGFIVGVIAHYKLRQSRLQHLPLADNSSHFDSLNSGSMLESNEAEMVRVPFNKNKIVAPMAISVSY